VAQRSLWLAAKDIGLLPMETIPSSTMPRGIHGAGVIGLAAAVVPFSMIVAEATGTLVPLGFVFLLITARLVLFNTNVSKFIKFFAGASIAHCIIGYFIALPTSTMIWIGSAAPSYYEESFAIIASGLLCCCVAMVSAINGHQDHWLADTFARLSIDERKLIRVAVVMCIAGAVLVIVVYARLGVIPLLSGSVGTARYFTQSLSDSYKRDEWVVNRGLDLLMYSVPLVFCFGTWNRKRLYQVIATIGFLALILPMRRSMLISIACTFLIMSSLRSGGLRNKYLISIVALVVLYAATQLLFLGIISDSGPIDAGNAAVGIGSALPEVRDLGWVISLTHGERYWGATLVQGLVPIPSFISDFSQRHSLRNVTTKLIGLDDSETTGGLRLTLAGEGYLNFGYVGGTLTCTLVGLVLAHINKLFSNSPKSLYQIFITSQLFAWFCFWVYLAGTQAAATIKIGIILVVVLTLISRVKQFPTAGAPA
jgi:hypothetical protein